MSPPLFGGLILYRAPLHGRPKQCHTVTLSPIFLPSSCLLQRCLVDAAASLSFSIWLLFSELLFLPRSPFVYFETILTDHPLFANRRSDTVSSLTLPIGSHNTPTSPGLTRLHFVVVKRESVHILWAGTRLSRGQSIWASTTEQRRITKLLAQPAKPVTAWATA